MKEKRVRIGTIHKFKDDRPLEIYDNADLDPKTELTEEEEKSCTQIADFFIEILAQQTKKGA